MNKYREALERLRVLEMAKNLHYQNQVAPQVDCDVLQELVDKATPKKPINQFERVLRHGYCPNCKGKIRKLGSRNAVVVEGQPYCDDCGQALDWSE